MTNVTKLPVAQQPAAPVTLGEMERMAAAVAKSGLFGVKTPEQALSLMLIAQAEGTHPALAARDYHVIGGRPTLKADAMLARYLAAGGRVEWHEYGDSRVAATFAHPAGGTLMVEWTIDRAKAAGLAGRDQWKAYPRQMLRARVISEGVRATYPGVAVGIYTPEEVADFEPPRNVTPPPPAPVAQAVADAATATALTDSEVTDHLDAITNALTVEDLRASYSSAYKHAQAAKDSDARAKFVAAYEHHKAAFT